MSGLVVLPIIFIPSMQAVVATSALALLGYNIVAGSDKLFCGGKTVAADHVLESESGLQIGVRTTKDGKLELLVDEDELRTKEGLDLKEFEEQLQQKYQYVKLKEQLEADGYSVVEETEEENETIRLVVRRWR
jgi:hypothetical protein